MSIKSAPDAISDVQPALFSAAVNIGIVALSLE